MGRLLHAAFAITAFVIVLNVLIALSMHRFAEALIGSMLTVTFAWCWYLTSQVLREEITS